MARRDRVTRSPRLVTHLKRPLANAARFLPPLLLAACHTPRDPQPVTPQRPTVSSDTSTTAGGTVELETGVGLDVDGSYWATPTTLKFGIQDSTEVFVGMSPLLHVDSGSTDVTGLSDLLVGMRHRVSGKPGEGLSSAVQLGTSLPSGNSSLSTGEIDAFGAGILTQQVGRGSMTGYYELGLLGDRNGEGTQTQHSLALAGGHPIDGRISGYGELAAVATRFDADLLFTTLGATYSLSEILVLDAGVRIGMNSDTPDLVLVFGLTTNFGRLW